jgi:hypothetical protein
MKLEVMVEVSVEMDAMAVVAVVLKLGGGGCYWSRNHILHFHD